VRIATNERLWPWEYTKVAKQENLFEEMGMPVHLSKRNEDSSVQISLF
jgi:hypothetical protein